MDNFSIVSNIAIINGDKGPYDGKVNNASVKYGRNSVANHYSFLNAFLNAPADKKNDFSNMNEKDLKSDVFEKKMTHNENLANSNTSNFEYKYLPGQVNPQNIDKMALLGSAYEEMGQKTEISVDEMNKQIQNSFGNQISAEAMDLNGDKKVDIGEYSATILLEDMAGKDPNKMDIKNISGTITDKSEENMLGFFNVKNKDTTKKTLTDLYNSFRLVEAQKTFIGDSNNLFKLDVTG